MRPIAVVPNMGDYEVAFRMLVEDMLHLKLYRKPTTKKTIHLGEMYSPDAICAPFKYHLGHFIEGLEEHAQIIIQVGGGCRVSYYGELQEKILRDLGYQFSFYELVTRNEEIKTSAFTHYYRILKQIRKDLNYFSYCYHGLKTIVTTIYLDHIDKIIRKKSCYEIKKHSFLNLKEEMKQHLLKTHHYLPLFFFMIYYQIKFSFLPIKKKKKKERYKVAIIGELYTLMDKEANNEIEEFFNQAGIELTRPLDLTYLVLRRKTSPNKLLKKQNPYIKYHLGATATDSVIKATYFAKKKYDGILHLKSFGCTPELSAIPILQKISEDYNIPITCLSFDLQNSQEGLRTRLEAFIDMLEMRREK